MAQEAVNNAIHDAKVISYKDFEAAFVGYVFGDSTCGQRALYPLGMTGIPIINVNNNCSTGSTALFLAAKHIEGGLGDCILALGFEKMQRGSLSTVFDDRTNPLDRHIEATGAVYPLTSSPTPVQLFGNAGREYLHKYTPKITYSLLFSSNSQFQNEYSLEQISQSPMIYYPLTKLQCCPTSDGGAAAILVSESFLDKYPEIKEQAVEILAIEMVTDLLSTFNSKDCMRVVGFDISKQAAQQAYVKAGVKPSDIQVIELHGIFLILFGDPFVHIYLDCFSSNELITYEALGLCGKGKAGELVERGDNTYGGKYVINPSGGLMSKGHPL
ncbi:unnamed protein product, partial [Adineta steineri]